jgi:CDP-ribitol ribitolphosphotransferase
VVFATNSSGRLRGNLRVLAEDISRRHAEITTVILTHRTKPGIRGKLGTLWASVVAQYYLATSTVFLIDDYFFPLYVARLKPETTVIQTWHASGAFKQFGYSVVDKSFGASKRLVDHVRIHSNYTFCLIASQAALPHYAEAFGQPPERFVSLGIPSTDVLFGAGRGAAAEHKVRKRYGLPEGKRVILYAPTFRGDTGTEARYDDYLDLRLMHDELGADHIVLLKLHPFVARRVLIDDELSHFVFDVSSHADINELMLMSDVLVTDYSSVIFEYSLLGKPMAFLAPDHAAYERERGLYFGYESGVPGPVFEDTGSLARFLRAGVFDLGRVRRFAGEMFDVADGHATERVVEELIVPHM